MHGAMDLVEHHSLTKLWHQLPAAIDIVTPKLLHVLWTRVVRCLRITHAPIIDGLQLPEIAYQDDGNVAEAVIVGIQSGFAEMAAPALL